MTNPSAKVLVVDDEENLCLLYREELESEGYRVKTAHDAAVAMKILEEDPPDVVVLDIRMPRMDGIEAMGKMLSRRQDLPVILNSAYSSYKDDFRSWPASAYVIKSSDLTELKRALAQVLGPGRGKA
jgi:DNA-binding NtrC family response regulator